MLGREREGLGLGSGREREGGMENGRGRGDYSFTKETLTYTSETVLWLKLLGRVQGVVDQGEPSRLATTESSAEAKHENVLLVRLVQLGQLFSEIILGDVGTTRVQDVDDLSDGAEWVIDMETMGR